MVNSTVILITGVSKGIGLRMAEICLDRPNHIVIGSVRDDTTPALLLVHIESTSPEDPKTAAEVVQAAGIDHTVPNSDIVWAFQANAAGPLGLFQAFRHLLQKSKAPRWVSISSSAGSISRVGPMKSYIVTAYGMSKAAQNFMTHQQEWLTVLDIHAGNARTEPGNWIARQIGLEQAPLSIDESAKAVLKTVSTSDSSKIIQIILHSHVPPSRLKQLPVRMLLGSSSTQLTGSVVPW
ncbi:hypothetical protein M434DRAFT_24414 [Hypoxylon sp. CO27-5]|nr:hypothetical protein M434DRAFT_24414 [Hypoxylon sp. CO27-5]